MLELLKKYAVDQGLDAEPGFKPKEIRWVLAFDEMGNFSEVLEVGNVEDKKNKGKTFLKCPDLSQPEMKAGGIMKSQFLAEAAGVVTLLGKTEEESGEKGKDPKTVAKHLFFLRMLQEAKLATPGLDLIGDSLAQDSVLTQIRTRLRQYKLKDTDKLTLLFGSRFILEDDSWHDWWRDFRRRLITKDSEAGKVGIKGRGTMRCLLTGDLVEPAKTHPKIERLADVGGIASGDVLIGFDKDAFTSYGLAQSANAAVSEDAANSYRAALNHLIKETGFRMAGAKVVHWFKKRIPVDDDPLSFLFEADTKQEIVAQERCRELLTSVRTGKRPDLGENHFYSLTLSGASGRVMVRDWMEGSFQELLTSIVLWFDDLAITHRDGSRLAPDPKFMAVLGGTVRELKDLPPNVTTRLWRAALKKEAIPFSVLAQALNRAKIDIVNNQPFNHARMGLIKAFNLRQNRSQGGDSMSDTLKPFLNEHHPHPAYHCGRLLAVMAALQRSALGDVGAGVVQRYYAAASTTPALVLGRLSRLSQFHLNKLDNPGLAIWYENLIAGIWGRMKDSPPGVLNLEEQSLFALGYYQQIASLRSPKAGKDQPEKGENNE